MKFWLGLIIPFGIQVPCLIVQLISMRKSMKIDRERIERIPWYMTENLVLWGTSRKLVKWVQEKHPESYEAFVSECLSDVEKEVLQMKENDNDTVGGT